MSRHKYLAATPGEKTKKNTIGARVTPSLGYRRHLVGRVLSAIKNVLCAAHTSEKSRRWRTAVIAGLKLGALRPYPLRRRDFGTLAPLPNSGLDAVAGLGGSNEA